jgi:hypothetical protein
MADLIEVPTDLHTSVRAQSIDRTPTGKSVSINESNSLSVTSLSTSTKKGTKLIPSTRRGSVQASPKADPRDDF